MTNRLPELVGQEVGHGKYALESVLGAGNFGTVFRAQEQLDGHLVRTVALKVYAPEASRLGHVEGMLADCTLPARILASDAPIEVKRHFAQIYDFGYLDTPLGRCAFVAMELIRGAETLENLMARYRRAGRFARPELILDYMTQFFTALDTAHRAGVLHRDIKGGNVMIDAGVIRVMDFGMGAYADQPEAALKTTMSIYAPENFDGRYTIASDIYQAGLMFYTLYTGLDPFAGDILHDTDMVEERAKRQRFQPRPGAAVPGVHASAFLDAVLAKCLAYGELNRYPSARAVLDALAHSDTAATAAQAVNTDPALALRLAEEALANPATAPEQRIAAGRTAAEAHAAQGDETAALAAYREAIAIAEASGALFHNDGAFNALVDAAVLLHIKRGQAGLARLLAKKKR
jgi:serine/threonine-protein kinase